MGSGLGSPMLAGLSVIITTKQLQFWGWTQLSPDFLAFYVSPMTQTDGREAWVWGGGQHHCSDEQGTPRHQLPSLGAEVLPTLVGAHLSGTQQVQQGDVHMSFATHEKT